MDDVDDVDCDLLRAFSPLRTEISRCSCKIKMLDESHYHTAGQLPEYRAQIGSMCILTLLTIASCSRSKESYISIEFGAVGKRAGPESEKPGAASDHELIELPDSRRS